MIILIDFFSIHILLMQTNITSDYSVRNIYDYVFLFDSHDTSNMCIYATYIYVY